MEQAIYEVVKIIMSVWVGFWMVMCLLWGSEDDGQ